jgi:hypothetical protein
LAHHRAPKWPNASTAVARHIDRFAFREVPLAFDWQDTLNG